jgi:hypothetical protein
LNDNDAPPNGARLRGSVDRPLTATAPGALAVGKVEHKIRRHG